MGRPGAGPPPPTSLDFLARPSGAKVMMILSILASSQCWGLGIGSTLEVHRLFIKKVYNMLSPHRGWIDNTNI